MGLSSYEEHRQKRVDENKKRLEDLNLIHLSQSLRNLSPKSSPMKKGAPRPGTVEKQMVAVRRSPRVSNNLATVYVEVLTQFLPELPPKSYKVTMGREWNGKYVTDDARANAIEKAEKLASKLEQDGFPTIIRPILPSHVSLAFRLLFPKNCEAKLPHTRTALTLIDEEGEVYPLIYVPGGKEPRLNGGWRYFAINHGLCDGDAVVFQLRSHSVWKVYIIRVNDDQEFGDKD